jgi:hypothetical protein
MKLGTKSCAVVAWFKKKSIYQKNSCGANMKLGKDPHTSKLIKQDPNTLNA